MAIYSSYIKNKKLFIYDFIYLAQNIYNLPSNFCSSSLPERPSSEAADGVAVFFLTASWRKSNQMSVT